MIYTIVLHHPARSTPCLSKTLQSLETATTEDHVVDVIVQGRKNPSGIYQPEAENYELRYVEVGRNLGIGSGFKLGVERFLQTDARRLAKIDDDITIPALAWDILDQIIHSERERNGRKLGSVMMANAKTKTRLLKRMMSPNGIKTSYPVDGMHEHSHCQMFDREVSWSITDFADIGCTLYSRQLFEDGCMPDEKLFVGGIGLDLVLAGTALGYEWAVCGTPKCIHKNKDCHTLEYKQARKNEGIYRNSCRRFLEKWEMIPLPLAKAADIVEPDGGIVLPLENKDPRPCVSAPSALRRPTQRRPVGRKRNSRRGRRR